MTRKKEKTVQENIRRKRVERIIHGIFLMLGLITVGCVLLITIYLVISGIPAMRTIGLKEFLFGQKWASTAAEPKFGILPFILTSIYGTAGAIVLGVPVGFFAAVYIAKIAKGKIKWLLQSAVGMLAGLRWSTPRRHDGPCSRNSQTI